MQVQYGWGERRTKGLALVMGVFDGVHVGHRTLLQRVGSVAREKGLLATALTFWPHPLAVLAPEKVPPLIQTLDERIAAIEASGGIDLVIVIPFTDSLAMVEADVFVHDYLLKRLGCQFLLVGSDARFGRGQGGDIALLQRYAVQGFFEVEVAQPVTVAGVLVSSSEIRQCIAAGDVTNARVLLGRPFSISGTVVQGAGRGSKLGFPTANLSSEAQCKPAEGVYACYAETENGTWPAAVHIGPIPTFGSPQWVIEAHLIGFSGDLLGQRIRVFFIERLRDVRSFEDTKGLAAAISADIRKTSEIVTLLVTGDRPSSHE